MAVWRSGGLAVDFQAVRRSGGPAGDTDPSDRSDARISWHLQVDPVGRSGAENMATDQALLDAANRRNGFLRLYRWNPPCLSFGRNEPAKVRYDVEEIRRLGLDTVRRPTGGRAVWHDAEVTYAVAAPLTTFGSLSQTYHLIHNTIAAALARLGVRATLARRPQRGHLGVGVGACFASPAGGEVVVGSRKLVGSAQVRENGAFLQHGSILLENGQDIVARITRGSALNPSATSLQEVLGRTPEFIEVAEAFAAEARACWPGDWRGDLRPAPVDPPAKLTFADPAWTWRR